MPTSSPDVLATAAAVADDVLFEESTAVDLGRSGLETGLDALAAHGLYGLHVPRSSGGLGLPTATADLVVELLAGGSLAATFVWIQHQGVVKRLVAAGGPLAEHHLPALAAGRTRAGVAVGGIRPGRDRPLTATADGAGWSLKGTVPWVTGWGHIDLLLVAAVDAAGDVVWLLLDAPAVVDPGGALRSSVASVSLDRVALVACDAANSAVVRFVDHRIAPDRHVLTQPYDEWLAADAAGLRGNGSLALGVATRCARLAGADDLHADIDETRDLLDAADISELPMARAAATALVWRAAQRLLVETGGRGVAIEAHAQRLAREAAFLQVFATRPSITAAQLARLHQGVGRER